MRSDYETSVVRLPNLQALFEQNVVRILPLMASELRESIEAPAAQIGLRFEEGVVDALLNDTLGEPAALPLLQFTLLKLWEYRDHNRVTWETYRKLGGGLQALARSADELYNDLIPEEQFTMRRILLKMVRPGTGLEVMSNRVQRPVLYQKSEANDRIDRVLDRLIQARLVRVSEGDMDADDQVEVAHEALIRNWPRLVDWLDEERVALRQRQRLTTAAEEWQRLDHEPSALWRGVLLESIRRYDDLNDLEKEFVEASFDAEQIEANRQLEEMQRQKDLEYAQKLAETQKLRADEQAVSVNQLRRSAVFLILISVIAVGLSIYAANQSRKAKLAQQVALTSEQNAIANANFALTQQANAEKNAKEAQRQGTIAQAGELSAEAIIHKNIDFRLSLLLGVAAYRKHEDFLTHWTLLDNTQTNPKLLRYLSAHTGEVYSVAVSPNGRILASGSGDRTIILWDLETGQPLRPPLDGHRGAVYGLAFSPDGKNLASGSQDHTIILWDVATGRQLGKLTGHRDQVFCIAFSPDGKTLASASTDNTIILWDVATQQPIGKPLTGQKRPVLSIAFSPNGSMLASGGVEKNIMLWDTSTHERIGEPMIGHKDVVRNVVFSPDGSFLASGSLDKTIILWDTTTHQAIGQPLTGHLGAVRSLAISSDGTTLASGSADNTIILWDVATREPIGEPLKGHSDIVRALAFSSDNNILVSGSYDHAIILWNLAARPLMGKTIKVDTSVLSMAFSPDGKSFATGNDDTSIVLRNLSSLEWSKTLRAHTSAVRTIAFSPNGKLLASGSADKTIILWDVELGKPIGKPLTGHTAAINSVAFSPDGKILASGSDDKTIILWDTATQRALNEPLTNHKDAVKSVAFSPDGKILASGGADNSIFLWDVATGQLLSLPLTDHSLAVNSLAFSPDGKILASGSDDNTIILWDIATLRQLGQLTTHSDPVRSVVFSTDGKILVSASADHTIILWDVATLRQLGQSLKEHSDSVNALAISPDGKTLLSGSSDNSVFIWNLDPQAWIENDCERAGRNLIAAEWLRFFHNEKYQITCEKLPIHPTVIAETVSQILSSPNEANRVQTAIGEASNMLKVNSSREGYAQEAKAIVKESIELQISKISKHDMSTETINQNLSLLENAKESGLDIEVDPDFFARIAQNDLQVSNGPDQLKAAIDRISDILRKETKSNDPDSGAKHSVGLAIQNIILESDLKTGDIGTIIGLAQNAGAVGVNLTDPVVLNEICWYGSIRDHAQDVIQYCDRAVFLEPDNSTYRGSRGLARAITGNKMGAISDFQYFIDNSYDSDLSLKRSRWIDALNAGLNPFTPDVLKRLLDE
jgi:WD40 repeat protein